MGVGDNPKRRSLLFPFAKSTPKETKFEVVNRKKNPAANLQANTAQSQQKRSPAPSPFDPQAPRRSTPSNHSSSNTTSTNARPTSSTTTSPRTSSSQAIHPPRLSLDPRSVSPFKSLSSAKASSSESISQADLPSSNLNVNFNVPPVPDYNSSLNAPPVTIKGRTVSLTKKDAPPRRKPPTVVDSLGAPVTNRSISDLSIQSQGSDAFSFQSSVGDSRLGNVKSIEEETSVAENGSSSENSHVMAGQEQVVPPSIVVTDSIPEEVKRVEIQEEPEEIEENKYPENEASIEPEVDKLEKRTAKLNLSEPTKQIETSTPEPHPTIEDQSYSDEYDDELSIQEEPPIQPPAPFSDPTKNVSQADSFASASDFMDARETEFSSPKAEIDPKGIESVQEPHVDELGDDPDSSFEVKPLFYHKKSKSTASESTRNDASMFTTEGVVTSPSKTHTKQLSLSDDILRDIEDFQSAIPSHVHDDVDEVSPVSPLAFQQQSEKPSLGRTGLYEEVSDDDANYGYEHQEPQRQLIVQNPDSDVGDTTTASLFQDSTDEEGGEVKSYNAFDDKEQEVEPYPINDDYDYNHVGGLNLESRASSVQPEINYHNSSLVQGNEDNQRRLLLTEDEGEEPNGNHEGYNEGEFNKFADENAQSYDGGLAIPRSHSLHNIPNDLTSHNERSSYSSNVPSQFRSSTSEDDGDRLTFERQSVEGASDQASSYNYYSQAAAQTRRFHVVNTGDYSDNSSKDQDSYEASFDQEQPESLNQDYSIVHQQVTNSSERDGESDENDLLSFTAKSPVQSDFNFENKNTPQQIMGNNVSDIDLSQPVTNFESPVSGSSPISSYDRREDTVAPVQYVSTYNGATRRPPPISDAPKTTRVARSLSTSVPLPVNYNTLQEGHSSNELPPPSESHEPEKSSYVEMLRMSSGTVNSEVPARVWGLPIGIADIDHSKMTAVSSRTAYKRAQRTSRSDLKHGKIKPRLLASEVDDDDSTEMVSGLDGQSIDLEKSKTPSIHSPTQSMSDFSPNRISMNVGVSRSGTLMGDKIGPQLGRSGSVMSTVKPVNNMTLFIANPDIEEDD